LTKFAAIGAGATELAGHVPPKFLTAGAQQNLWGIYSGQQMPNFATIEYVLYKIALLEK